MAKIWCEINKEQLLNNVNIVKKHIGNKKLIAVLKANAYGIGVKEVSEIIDDSVDMYAVSNVTEYENLQTNKDVLIMSPLCSIDDFQYAENKDNLILSIDNIDILKVLNKNTKYRVHICVDTTNHRMGIETKNLKNVISTIDRDFKNITIEGIYTHFHNTSNVSETMEQIECFKNIVALLGDKDYMIHCVASSIANNQNLLKLCDFSNACRIGNMIYGFMGANVGIKKVYKFYGKILQKHKVCKGELIGFGASYELATKDMIVGIVEVGHFYGLGCNREFIENPIKSFVKSIKYNLKGIDYIKVDSSKIDIVGTANMNSLIIDITDNSEKNMVEILMSPILADSHIKKIYV